MARMVRAFQFHLVHLMPDRVGHGMEEGMTRGGHDSKGREGEGQKNLPKMGGSESGAENGARTRDLNLGKVTLYQLSYFRNTFPRNGTANIRQNL